MPLATLALVRSLRLTDAYRRLYGQAPDRQATAARAVDRIALDAGLSESRRLTLRRVLVGR